VLSHTVAGRPGADVGSAISSLIVAAERGDRPAAEALFAALYSELHRLAKREPGRHGLQVSLSATTLLHEAYLDMAERDGPSFPDRARFMGYAARVMRGLIIDLELATTRADCGRLQARSQAPEPHAGFLFHRLRQNPAGVLRAPF